MAAEDQPRCSQLCSWEALGVGGLVREMELGSFLRREGWQGRTMSQPEKGLEINLTQKDSGSALR